MEPVFMYIKKPVKFDLTLIGKDDYRMTVTDAAGTIIDIFEMDISDPKSSYVTWPRDPRTLKQLMFNFVLKCRLQHLVDQNFMTKHPDIWIRDVQDFLDFDDPSLDMFLFNK